MNALKRESGGFAEKCLDSDAGLWSTVSVLKTLKLTGLYSSFFRENSSREDLANHTASFLLNHRDAGTGLFAENNQPASPIITALGLIGLNVVDGLGSLGEEGFRLSYSSMQNVAADINDHFMVVAVADECNRRDLLPDSTIDYFRGKLADPDLSIIERAKVNTALIRGGFRELIENHDVILESTYALRNSNGIWGDTPNKELLNTYFFVRLFSLLKLPIPSELESLFTRRRCAGGGFSTAPKLPASAGATYQMLSLIDWYCQASHPAIAAARSGSKEFLKRWHEKGYDLNCRDSFGWTPLLAAAARGQAETVKQLLHLGADPNSRFVEADALPIYMAGQNGDYNTINEILTKNPDHLDSISTVNGHTLVLQLCFYGGEKHRDSINRIMEGLTVEKREALLAATNVRGFNSVGMAELWQNQPLLDLLSSLVDVRLLADRSSKYFEKLLVRIGDPHQKSTALILAINRTLEEATQGRNELGLNEIADLIKIPGFDINAQGGNLRQPPLVYAVTGPNSEPDSRSERRREVVKLLLENGAVPAAKEEHPMAVGAVIRASVLARFDLLKMLAEKMTPEEFAEEMNLSPAVNGLTALHDAVHRALTVPQEDLSQRLEQLRYMVSRGADPNLPDHTGMTQLDLARSGFLDPAISDQRVETILKELMV